VQLLPLIKLVQGQLAFEQALPSLLALMLSLLGQLQWSLMLLSQLY
jgi:hypothetical protein